MKKEWEVEKENRQLIRETFIALKANSTQFFLFFLLVYWNQSHNKSISTKIYFCIIFFSLPCLPYYSLRYTHFCSFFFWNISLSPLTASVFLSISLCFVYLELVGGASALQSTLSIKQRKWKKLFAVNKKFELNNFEWHWLWERI